MSGDGSSTVSRELWKTMLMVRNTNTRRIRAPMLQRDQETRTDIRQIFTNFLAQALLNSREMCGDSDLRVESFNLETLSSISMSHTITRTHMHADAE